MPRLNEGHTVYLERMIGRCMEGEQFRQFKAMGGWKDLQDSVSFSSRSTVWLFFGVPDCSPSSPLGEHLWRQQPSDQPGAQSAGR